MRFLRWVCGATATSPDSLTNHRKFCVTCSAQDYMPIVKGRVPASMQKYLFFGVGIDSESVAKAFNFVPSLRELCKGYRFPIIKYNFEVETLMTLHKYKSLSSEATLTANPSLATLLPPTKLSKTNSKAKVMPLTPAPTHSTSQQPHPRPQVNPHPRRSDSHAVRAQAGPSGAEGSISTSG